MTDRQPSERKPPKSKTGGPLKKGWTTGACATAAASGVAVGGAPGTAVAVGTLVGVAVGSSCPHAATKRSIDIRAPSAIADLPVLIPYLPGSVE